ncbi:N-acetyltransferase 9 [Orchesella cincta]|uniref:N-acetyltransferase 9 n=1 Tax=Orchesella cincta TaxID=48709 RepID=A0A1D2NCV4_ORCCI|nr:N-acetyltransferase 9 [Orchesella cincta]
MRHDDNFKIVGNKVVLVPYRESHVPKYHEWMGDEETLRLTGSDRLTLDEEFEMQQKWAEDNDKCTFIILDEALWKASEGNEVEQSPYSIAEIEIMIAEKSARRKGLASEALTLIMTFGKEELGVQKFIAKIKEDNESSIALFQKLGFREVARSTVFHEVTLEKHS